MRKLLKILGATLATIVLVIGVIVIYLFTLFDPNDYKSEIRTLIKEQTRMDVVIKGNLTLSVFPWLGFSVNELQLSTPQGQLASVSQAQVFAKLESLLDKKLEVDGLGLTGLKLNLEVDRDGKGNWEIDQPESTQQAPATADNPALLPLAAFSVGHITLEDAEINYQNRQNNQSLQISAFSLRTSNVNPNESFPVSADFKLLAKPGAKPIPIHLTAKVAPGLQQESARIEDLVLDLDQTRIRGEISLSRLFKQPALDAKIQMDELRPSRWAQLLGVPQLKQFAFPIGASTQLLFDSSEDTLDLKNLLVESSAFNLKADLAVKAISTAPTFQGQLKLAPLNPKTQLPQFGIEAPETTNPEALKKLGGTLTFSGTGDSLRFSKLNITLDESTITGSFGVRLFDQPDYQYQIQIDRLNLDDYLTPADTNAEQPSETENNKNALLLPLAAMSELNITGILKARELKASGLTLENLVFDSSARNGLVNINRVNADLYGGTVQASGRIDARTKTPQLSFKKKLTRVEASPALKAWADIDSISGKLDLDIAGYASGNTLDQIERSLNGNINFSVAGGLLSGISLERMVCQGIASLRGTQLAASDATAESPVQTKFNTLEGTMTITDGLVETDAMNVAINSIKGVGSGTISLPDETLDYKITATLIGDLEDKACGVNERYRDIAWPLQCKGSWDAEPSDLCGLDQRALGRIISKLAEQELKRKAAEALGDKFGKQLEGLFDLWGNDK